MPAAKKAKNESQRLKSLKRYQILDTEQEQAFDDLVELAADICQAPVALISLVDEDRQWFKAKVGLDACETHRDMAFCGHAILNEDILVVEDAREDDRFKDNPLVNNAPKVIFYAGVPLKNSEGFNLGTLCVIDHLPRKISQKQVEALKKLARQVVGQMELRRSYIDQKTVNEDLFDFTLMLKEIQRLNCRTFDSPTEMMNEYLRSASFILDLPFGIVSRVVDNIYTVEAAVSPGDQIPVGATFELENTYCELVFKKRQTVSIENVGALEEMKSHPVYQAMKLEAYISTPLWVNKELLGTLNFSSTEVRERCFTKYEKQFIEILGQAIARRMEIYAAQADISKKVTQIERLQRRVSIERLAGGVAHEINNPLAVLSCYVDQLRQLVDFDGGQSLSDANSIKKNSAETKNRLQGITSNIDHTVARIAKIVNALLVFSREDMNGHCQSPSVLSVFEQARDMLSEQINQKKIDLKIDLPDGDFELACDRMQMVEVVYSLMKNSIYALQEVEAPEIVLKACFKEGKVELTVVDNGPGISTSLVENIFEPFSTDKPVGQGQGLGLAVARGLVEANHGELSLKSPSGPTSFSIKLKAS